MFLEGSAAADGAGARRRRFADIVRESNFPASAYAVAAHGTDLSRVQYRRRHAVPQIALPLWLTLKIVTNILFRKEWKCNLLFSGGEKSNKKAAGTLATVSQTPQRFKGRKGL